MCVLYISIRSKIGLRTVRCVAMGRVWLFILGFASIFCKVRSEQTASCFGLDLV